MSNGEVITTHKVVGDTGMTIEVMACDERGVGGANQRYEITGFDSTGNPSAHEEEGPITKTVVVFQHGNPTPNGFNGITIESLLAICAHRLAGFQDGPFPCSENEQALTGINLALDALAQRTVGFIRKKQEEVSK